MPPVRVAATVLVVDDDAQILHLMKQVLGRDFAVHTASSAEEALQLLRREKVHAVVSDHMLPAMSGVDLLREVASLQPDAARVLITASPRVDTAQDAINLARVRRFLTKPFRAAELLSTVGEAIHESAVAQIKSELVRELKSRNNELSRAMESVEARDRSLSEHLHGLAFRDTVTGLYTHRFFQETLSAATVRARASRKGFALVLADVDRFRAFNQEQGFAEGDLLLGKVATLLAGADAASRFGADRFAVLLPGADDGAARAWAERLRAKVEAQGRAADSAGAFTVRAGYALFPEDGADEGALVAAAEGALGRAKARGGNRVERA
jgi:diguanylate cyclase (GGDEF)-like protein